MAVELRVISSMATRALLTDLAGTYESQHGVTVHVESVGGVDAARRVRAGDAADVVVLASGVMRALEAEGRLLAGSLIDVAQSAMAVAVPAGAPRPAISSPEQVKAAILKASAIAYSTGPSGDYLESLLKLWGVAEAVSARLTRAPPGLPVATLLARGDADLGFQQLSELLHAPDIQVLGPLPIAIQSKTIFSGGVASVSLRPDEGRALLDFLRSLRTADVKRRKGMEPVVGDPSV